MTFSRWIYKNSSILVTLNIFKKFSKFFWFSYHSFSWIVNQSSKSTKGCIQSTMHSISMKISEILNKKECETI